MSDAPSFIGVDLGGTHLRAAAVDEDGTLLEVRRLPTSRDGPRAILAQIEQLIAEVRRAETAGVGVGVPCAVDGRSGIVPDIPALPGWNRVPLAELLRTATGLPVTLENDAKCATLGEWRSGAARGCTDFVYVTVSTGIGGGIVADNRLIRGNSGLAGEIGHTKFADQSALCDCGQQGCWQAVASGTALVQAAVRAIAENPDSLLARVAAGGPPDGRDVQDTAEAGCPIALRLLRDEAHALAWGFANIQHLYDPAMIAVGGGVSQALPLMLDAIRYEMSRRLLPAFHLAEIVQSHLGDDAGVIGAAMLAGSSIM